LPFPCAGSVTGIELAGPSPDGVLAEVVAEGLDGVVVPRASPPPPLISTPPTDNDVDEEPDDDSAARDSAPAVVSEPAAPAAPLHPAIQARAPARRRVRAIITIFLSVDICIVRS